MRLFYWSGGQERDQTLLLHGESLRAKERYKGALFPPATDRLQEAASTSSAHDACGINWPETIQPVRDDLRLNRVHLPRQYVPPRSEKET